MCANLVLLGGGHANLPLIQHIPDLVRAGHRVTCVSLSPVHYYSGMGPGMLGGAYTPEQIRFPIQVMVEQSGGTFIRGRASRIEAHDREVVLSDDRRIGYDVLSVNTGSTVAPTVHIDAEARDSGLMSVFHVKPIEQMVELRAHVLSRLGSGTLRISVVGGGPAAVESAANLVRLIRESTGNATVTLFTGRQALPGFPPSAERRIVAGLETLGVVVRTSARVDRIVAGGLVVGSSTEPADVAVLATGVVPSRLFADSDLPLGPDGSLAVNEHLHALGQPGIFGGGDCIWFTPRNLPRAGVFAVRQGPVLVHNVVASLDHGPMARLRSFSPGGNYLLLLNMGDDTALFWRRIFGLHIVYRGHSAYRLKDRIDRAFMTRFGSEANRANSP